MWFGIVGPAGMRSKIVRRLNAELNTIFVMNDVKRRFAESNRSEERRLDSRIIFARKFRSWPRLSRKPTFNRSESSLRRSMAASMATSQLLPYGRE